MCTGCGRKSAISVHVDAKENKTVQPAMVNIPKQAENNMAYAPKSADPTKKVHLIYNGGGGSSRATGSGCHTCHGGSKSYSTITNETIMFVSEDAPGGIYKEVCAIGHSYFVTEEQAKYLLTLTYVNRSGQKVHKFTKKEV